MVKDFFSMLKTGCAMLVVVVFLLGIVLCCMADSGRDRTSYAGWNPTGRIPYTPQQLSVDPNPSHTVRWLTNGIMMAGPPPTNGNINSIVLHSNSQEAVRYLGQFLATIDQVLKDPKGDAYRLASGDPDRFALPDAWRTDPVRVCRDFSRMISLEDKQGWANPFMDPLPAMLATYIALHPNATKEEGMRAFSYLREVSWNRK